MVVRAASQLQELAAWPADSPDGPVSYVWWRDGEFVWPSNIDEVKCACGWPAKAWIEAPAGMRGLRHASSLADVRPGRPGYLKDWAACNGKISKYRALMKATDQEMCCVYLSALLVRTTAQCSGFTSMGGSK